MELMQIAIIVAALLCALVAGLVLTFAIVVMPGIRELDDVGYLRAFKVMDRVIQNNQPLFMLVWLGSALILLATTLFGVWQLEGLNRVLLMVACAIYLLGVQIPTVTINVPLNNRLQAQDLESMSETEVSALAQEFESRWVRWNTIRTVLAILTSVLLLVLLIRV